MKYRLLLLAVAAAFTLGACADGIEPEGPERQAAGYSPDPTGHVPRKDTSAARQAGF